jgi:glycogen(starch) synthase
MMRIALVTFEYPPDTAFGGIATYAQQAAEVLHNRGHHVEVFAASGARSGTYEISGITVHLVLGLDRTAFAQAVLGPFSERHRMISFDVVESPESNADGSAILDAHPDVAHVVKLHTPSQLLAEISVSPPSLKGWTRHQVSQTRMAVGALRRVKMPRFRSYAPDRAKYPPSTIGERRYAEKSDIVVSPSEALLKWALAQWSLDESRTMVVPYPFAPAKASLSVPLQGKGQTIGFFGRLEQRKGISDLIEAVPLILAKEKNVRFRFVGRPVIHSASGERFDKFLLRRLKRHRGSIELVGGRPLSEMPQEYAKVDICVFPSVWENFPNVCLEAMAAGRAIVASSAGGMKEMLENGKHGIMIPPKSPTAIADAVVRLIRCSEERLKFGVSARQRVLDAYAPAVIGPQLEASYRRAIDVARARMCSAVTRDGQSTNMPFAK